MSETETTEAGLAALLAETLAASEWWERFARSPDDGKWRDEMAAKALHLYDRTAPTFEALLSATEVMPIHHACAVIREIADAAAMRSCIWQRDSGHPSSLSRAGIELIIRLNDVDDWAEEHGYRLRLESDSDLASDGAVPDEVWPDGYPAEIDEDQLADDWLAISQAYDGTIDLQEAIARARDEDRLQLREAAAGLINGARWWMPWARRTAPTDGVAVVGSAIFMAEANYIVSTQQAANPSLFPTREFLREFLTDSGGLAWLNDHEAELPDWLD